RTSLALSTLVLSWLATATATAWGALTAGLAAASRTARTVRSARCGTAAAAAAAAALASAERGPHPRARRERRGKGRHSATTAAAHRAHHRRDKPHQGGQYGHGQDRQHDALYLGDGVTHQRLERHRVH